MSPPGRRHKPDAASRMGGRMSRRSKVVLWIVGVPVCLVALFFIFAWISSLLPGQF